MEAARQQAGVLRAAENEEMQRARRLREEAGDEPIEETPEELMPESLRDPDLIQAAIHRYEQEQAALEAALSPSARR